MQLLGRIGCALWGHEDYLHFEKNRIYLQCVACGYESPGWTVEARRPVLRLLSRRTTGAGARAAQTKKIA